VIFHGVISREELIKLEQSSAFFFSSEFHAACPNAVIEAIACGLPIIGFDTGSLKDLSGNAGIIVPYGTDPWKLEKPVCGPLIDAAEKVIQENSAYRQAARRRAEADFSLETMASAYINYCLYG
jgi:glycosyltransferase involved in cell wall biosynthesis